MSSPSVPPLPPRPRNWKLMGTKNVHYLIQYIYLLNWGWNIKLSKLIISKSLINHCTKYDDSFSRYRFIQETEITWIFNTEGLSWRQLYTYVIEGLRCQAGGSEATRDYSSGRPLPLGLRDRRWSWCNWSLGTGVTWGHVWSELEAWGKCRHCLRCLREIPWLLSLLPSSLLSMFPIEPKAQEASWVGVWKPCTMEQGWGKEWTWGQTGPGLILALPSASELKSV